MSSYGGFLLHFGDFAVFCAGGRIDTTLLGDEDNLSFT